MVGGLPIRQGRVEAPICEWPEVRMCVRIVDGEVADEMGKGGQREERWQALPARTAIGGFYQNETEREPGEEQGN